MTNTAPADTKSTPSENWFVVWTEPRAEKRVESRIAAQGLEPWLPRVTERHRWSDRWREVSLPLFPGYLFARGRQSQLPVLLRTPGVLTIVKNAGRPALLSDNFVSSLRRAIEAPGVSPLAVTDKIVYEVDDEVVVREGPLAGLRGVVQEVRGGQRLIVWITEIGRGVAFTIGSSQVSRASTETVPHSDRPR